jgi:hypothetical protein
VKDLYARLAELATVLDVSGCDELAEMVRRALDRLWLYGLTERERGEINAPDEGGDRRVPGV